MAPASILGGPEHRGGIKRSSHTALGSISARRRGKSALFEAVRAYISGLTVTQGAGIGEPFRILPWETRFLRGALAPGVGEAALTVARGAGKSTLVAAIACAYLDGDGTAAPASEITLVATTLKQSRKVFAHVVRFLEASGRMGDFRKQDTVNVCGLQNRRDGRALECLGAHPGGLHGAAPALVLADEVAQWPAARVHAMLAAIRTGLGKVPHSRLIMLGTRAATPGHPFARALETADYCQIHAARPDDPIGWKRTWCRANPSLPYFPDMEAATRLGAKRAKLDPAELASFQALRLNLGVPDVAEALLLPAGTWQAAVGPAVQAGSYILGIDLGTSLAMSAAAGYWPDTGKLDAVGCFGSEPDVRTRGLRDGVGSLYADCEARGELVVAGGRVNSLRDLLEAVWQSWGAPGAIVCDRWREAELRDALKALSWPVVNLVLRGMGYKDGGEDVRTFRRAFLSGEVTPAPNLLLAAAMAEARTVTDPAGNSKLAKGGAGRREHGRDDAAAAAILAVSLGHRRRGEPTRGRLRSGIV